MPNHANKRHDLTAPTSINERETPAYGVVSRHERPLQRCGHAIHGKKILDTVRRPVVNLSAMAALTTAEAAAEAGVTVRQWHYWADKLGVEPLRQLTGPRGAKFWGNAAVRKVAAEAGDVAA